TGSRGGWLAFLAAICVCIIFFLVQGNVIINRQRAAKLSIAFMIVIALFITTKPLLKHTGDIDGDSLLRVDQINVAEAMRIKDSMNSVEARLKIFDIAWQRIKQKPWLGYGYNHFQYYQLSDQDMTRMGKLTKFVHNDYLQIWFETGLPGLLILIVLILVLYLSLLRGLGFNDENRMVALGLSGTFTAYFIHALVDFVLYPPVLLLMFGICLGVASTLTNSNKKPAIKLINLSGTGIRPIVARWATGVLLLALLSQPVLAQVFYDRANRDKQSLDMKNALMFYELARRFAPWQPDYYFVEGNIWRHAALVTGDKEAADHADKLFQEGIAANPFRMESLYLRALLHRDLPHLLSKPADDETVLRWFETIMQWHPHDIVVKLDYLRALRQYGHNDRTEKLYHRYLKEYPRSKLLQDFEMSVIDRQ
ncbi:MAG TPA: O-antigen ligase family protein, partial [Gammaproteobacteria bacterium]|nr:O-antigen ligase family protein [Gammaproteobacteria bacterium]